MITLPTRSLLTFLFSASVTLFSLNANAASAATTAFIQKAAIGGLFEIQLAKLTQGRTDNIEVVKFAQRMIQDHGDANNSLKMTVKAGAPDVDLPTVLDEDRKRRLDAIAGMKGQDFADAFVNAQIDAHEEAIALFTSYAATGDQPDLKKFAADTLPTLKSHQEAIRHFGAK